MNRSLPVVAETQGTNLLEIVQRNGHVLPIDRRDRWMSEMTRPVRATERVPWPERIILELANTCNLDCPMCRVGEFGVSPERFMSRMLFDQIANELFPHVREVRLNGLGEATLVPWFHDCVDRVARAGLHGEIITNLTCDDETIVRLIEARFVVLVSWDAATPALFEKLRRPARFDEQLSKLRRLSAVAQAANLSDHLHLLFTLQRGNIEELPAMVRLATDAGIPNVLVNVVKLQDESWISTVAARIDAAIRDAREVTDRTRVHLTLPDHIGPVRLQGLGVLPSSAAGCDRPFHEVVIRWNGEVTVCNMFNPYTYGHLGRHGFERCWNGSIAQAFRKLVNSPQKHPYCEGCHYVHGVYEQTRTGL